MRKARPRRETLRAPGSRLPLLRVSIVEAAEMLRMSRALLYQRIRAGSIKVQKDGMRTYISLAELKRYVALCDRNS